MLIQELTKEDSLNLVAHMRLGRLACSRGAQPYVVPSYFTYSDNYLYSFATVGQKIEWMRANPLVCVEMDEVVTSEEWVSIIIFGRYQELPDTSEWKKERVLAYELLQRKANWWEPGYAKTIVHGTERPLVPVYFRIQILRVTGHHSTADSTLVADATLSAIDPANMQPIHSILGALRKRLFPK